MVDGRRTRGPRNIGCLGGGQASPSKEVREDPECQVLLEREDRGEVHGLWTFVPSLGGPLGCRWEMLQ